MNKNSDSSWALDAKKKIEKRQHFILNIENAEKEVRRAFANLNQKIIELNKLYL